MVIWSATYLKKLSVWCQNHSVDAGCAHTKGSCFRRKNVTSRVARNQVMSIDSLKCSGLYTAV